MYTWKTTLHTAMIKFLISIIKIQGDKQHKSEHLGQEVCMPTFHYIIPGFKSQPRGQPDSTKRPLGNK